MHTSSAIIMLLFLDKRKQFLNISLYLTCILCLNRIVQKLAHTLSSCEAAGRSEDHN